MLDYDIENRLIRLEKQNKYFKWLILILIILIFLIIVSQIFFTQEEKINIQNVKNDSKDPKRLWEAIKNIELKMETLQRSTENKQEYEIKLELLNNEINHIKESLGQLITPNLFSPWQIHNGRAGVWFIDETGEGKWLPNTYVEELTLLLDNAIRNGFHNAQTRKEDSINISIYLTEEGPSESITIDLANNKIIYRNEHYSIAKEDIEIIKAYFHEKGVDGNSR